MKPFGNISRAFLILFALAAVLVACYRPIAALPAYAEDEAPPAVTLVADGVVFASVPLTNGQFTVPQEMPEKEGYVFYGWSDGFARYEPGKTYTVAGELTIYAVWEEIPPPKPPFFTAGEKIAFWGMVSVLCLLIMFAYYWFGVTNRSLKDLKEKIRSVFRRR